MTGFAHPGDDHSATRGSDGLDGSSERRRKALGHCGSERGEAFRFRI
jgi:hypothetical protein